MTIEICTVGGYSGCGRNMTAVKVGDDVVIIDMGVNLPALIEYEGEEEIRTLSADNLIKIGAIPDDGAIKEWKNNVRAIVLGHCHLDHIAAVQYLAGKYDARVYGTPFTLEVLKQILRDDKIEIPNELIAVKPNGKVKINNNLTIELINVTHSTLQCAMVCLHTNEGLVLYANDFKFDNSPVLGEKPNYKRLQEIGKSGKLKALIVESLYATREMKTPSEKVARELLQDVLFGVENSGKAVYVTTFASHLARIRSIIDCGKRMKRKVVILGRSMGRYIRAAENLSLVKYSKETEMAVYRNEIKKALTEINKNPGKYLIVGTGNQGEPNSILDKIVNGVFPFSFRSGDHVIFSCRTIPHPMNVANRASIEERLKRYKVRIFTEIHVSGHAAREDLRDFIEMVRPEHIIPAHGDGAMETSLAELAEEIGYKSGENVHVVGDGNKIKIV